MVGGKTAPTAISSFHSLSKGNGFLSTDSLLGNGRNTVSRVLFRKRELTEFCLKLGEFALAHR